jgi:hypothetical protein
MKFVDARNVTVTAAINKWGRNADETKAVCEAWYAVGVGGSECFYTGSGGIVNIGGNGNPTGEEVGVLCGRDAKIYGLVGTDPNSNIVWESSPNLEISERPNNSVRVSPSATPTPGVAYITATIDGTTVLRYDLWLGEPQVEMRYEQTIPYQVYVHLEGANGTDITKQGITNVDWQLVNPTGYCIPSLDIISNPNAFVALVQANCYNWAAQMQVGVTNECGTIPFVRNITSDGYLGGGGGGYPCYSVIDYYGFPLIVPCGSTGGGLNPFGRQENKIQQFTIYDYMGVNYGTYQNTNVLPTSKLPFGLYFIKGIDKEGNLFTLKYLKK